MVTESLIILSGGEPHRYQQVLELIQEVEMSSLPRSYFEALMLVRSVKFLGGLK